MNRSGDWIVRAFILFSITIITRLAFPSAFLYHQDSVQFALGLESFDVYLHQPHPPGYFLYVMAGKLVNYFVHDANRSLIWLSLIASGLTVAAIYRLGRAIFDETVAIWAGLLAVTSPLLWFYGEIALSYVVAVFFECCIALFCWQILQKDNRRLLLSAVLLGVTAGIRQDFFVFLFPLWIFCVGGLGWRKAAIALFVLSVTLGSWFVPMLFVSGGPERYFAAVRELWQFHNSHFAIWNAGIASRDETALTILGFVAYGAGIGAVFLFFGLYLFIRTGYWRRVEKKKLVFFSLWLAPALLFYSLVFVYPYNHAYGLFFVPAFLLLLPSTLTHIVSELKKFGSLRALPVSRAVSAALGAVVVLNTAAFTLANISYSAKSIREHDQNLEVMLAGIKKTFQSNDTIILDNRSSAFYGYRHIQYYLPEYEVYLTDLRVNENGDKWHIFGARKGQTFLSNAVQIAPNIKHIVYLIDPRDREYAKALSVMPRVRNLSLNDHVVLYYQEVGGHPERLH